jgi:hypothetical protein
MVFTAIVKLEKGGSVVMKQKIFLLLSICLCFIVWVLPVNAAELHPVIQSGKTFFSDDNVTIGPHESIEHVVDLGGNVIVGGKVHEIIVIGGNLHLQKSARVRDFILVIGGSITQEPGTITTESLFHIGTDQQILNSLIITGSALFGLWFFQLSLSLLLMLLPIGAAAFWKTKINSFVRPIRMEFKRLMLVGLAASILLVAVGCVLVISIIGIPLVLALLLLVAVFSVICLTAVSLMIGEQFPSAHERQPWLNAAIGSVLVVALLNIPLIGLFIFMGLYWLALGIMTTWLWEKKSFLFRFKR